MIRTEIIQGDSRDWENESMWENEHRGENCANSAKAEMLNLHI